MVEAADVPVVILCGGQGTRLRDVTENLPKPLVDIGGQPVLWHVMKLYGSYGFRRFVLCLGYRSWNIKEYFIRYRENLADFTVALGGDGALQYCNDAGMEDWEVTLAETGVATQTGGRLGRVAPYLRDDPVFALT
jgi:glucose-1-phosphate cytidylyltransferase